MAPRYERSGLTDDEASALRVALVATMERDRLYRDSELTLADLADRLETTPHKLSEVLNSELEQTFYDFVNSYRVKDVQRRIADESSRNLKILALAMDAGFASKSTFNAVFRQHTGHTPSSYRRSVSADVEHERALGGRAGQD
jgi:AraC-like DNA-binding protein